MYEGISSLFFLIPTIHSFYIPTLFTWKLSNSLLVCASFSCNVSNFDPTLVLFDYLAIYLVSISYLNNLYIAGVFTILLLYEYYYHKTIETTKNIVFLISSIKSIQDTNYILSLCTSLCSASILYFIRNYKYKYNQPTHLWTMLFHVAITNVLYISSFTAY
jgi:hypothetical protein